MPDGRGRSVAKLLIAEAQVSTVLGTRQITNIGFLDIQLLERVGTAAYVVVLVAHFVLELEA
jgi:hypothetical protein